MENNYRRLDDPANAADTTLLTLPLSDFPNSANSANIAKSANAAVAATAATTDDDDAERGDEIRDEDALILVRLPPSNNDNDDDDGGLTVDDLVNGRSVYILGDTSESDIRNDVPPLKEEEEKNGHGGMGGSIEPVAARLIIEGGCGDVFSGDGGGCNGNGGTRGKTLELTRVETSNTYVLVPPMPRTHKENDDCDSNNNDSNKKRRKMTNPPSGGDKNQKAKPTATMPARSVGLVPGEESPSCFFLDPTRLRYGHFAARLRAALGRWTYDPFDPPTALRSSSMEEEEDGRDAFGYTVAELAHVCRTSRSEIERAVRERECGAEEALAIPSSSSRSSGWSTSSKEEIRYGTLSEEGRQTVDAAILSALLETDSELAWDENPATASAKGREQADLRAAGTPLSPLVEEIRSRWHRAEGTGDEDDGAPSTRKVTNPYAKKEDSKEEDSESRRSREEEESSTTTTPVRCPLPTEIVWHRLRPVCRREGDRSKDVVPERARLLPDAAAVLAAHDAFLSVPASSSSSFSASRGIGGGVGVVWRERGELWESWSARLPQMPSGRGTPRDELLRGVALPERTRGAKNEGGDDAPARRWRYFPAEGLPEEPKARIGTMFAAREAWTAEEAGPYLERFARTAGGGGSGSATAAVAAELLGRHARATRATGKDADGREVSRTEYVAISR